MLRLLLLYTIITMSDSQKKKILLLQEHEGNDDCISLSDTFTLLIINYLIHNFLFSYCLDLTLCIWTLLSCHNQTHL